jgi:hypothetical protein
MIMLMILELIRSTQKIRSMITIMSRNYCSMRLSK